MDNSELARIQRESIEALMAEIEKVHDRINLEQLRTQIAFGAVVAELESVLPNARKRMLETIDGVRVGLSDSPIAEVAARLAKELINPDHRAF